MAGFFGFFDYTKPGPGVPRPEDSPHKKGIRIFFEVLQRKFWKIIRIGMLFFILNIPAILVASFLANYFSYQLLGEIEDVTSISVVIFWGAIILTVLPIITFGPARAGFEAVYRNFSKEEHSFLWTDFKDNMKSNFKQSIIVSLINFIIFIILSFDVILMRAVAFDSTIIWILFNSFFIMFFLIYLMANIYIYPMMVTFQLSTKNLIKNSVMFAFVRFIPNLIILAIVFGVISLAFMYLNPVFGIFVAFLLLYGILGFLINFFAHRGFKKYILDRMVKEQDKNLEEPTE